MAGERVAGLEFRSTDRDEYDTHHDIKICGNEQFFLGRDSGNCRYCWHDELSISRLHLRIHCILYDQDFDSDIAPLVYATDMSANGTYLKKANTDCARSQSQGVRMGRNSPVLLDEGDELQISDSVTLVYRSRYAVTESALTPTQAREENTFASRYLVTGRLLGQGAFGKVLVGIDQKTQRQVACKLVQLDCAHNQSGHKLRRTSSAVTKELRLNVAKRYREFDILKDLSHPNIVAIEKVFWSQSTIYIFQELVTGGDLFSFIAYKNGRLDSILAAVIIRQMLKALEYLHCQDIVHRDIKPENVLMTSLDDGARIILTDFGNSRCLPECGRQNQVQRMFSLVGTLAYSAPEVYSTKKGYSKSVDMWSIGSITTTLLAGEPLFAVRNYSDDEEASEQVRSRTEKCDLSILDREGHPVWSTAGDRPKDFIRRLLVLEEEKRMSATEALAHAWFSDPYFAADFEDLYQRSIQDWHPRLKDPQLVEQIYTPTPDLASFDPPSSSQDVVSSFFQQSPVHDILQSLSAAQRCRANTPLPAIGDNYEADQFASPIVAPTQRGVIYNTDRYRSNTYNSQRFDDTATPVYDEYNTYNIDTSDESDLPSLPHGTPGEYRSSDDEFGDSSSLDEVMDETYEVLADGKYCEDLPKPTGDASECESEVHDTDMVQETPPKKLTRQILA